MQELRATESGDVLCLRSSWCRISQLKYRSIFSLEQNYPNPFNPSTNLEFDISKLGFVSLKVYEVLGKEVATLVNENLSPGIYKVEFDGSNLTSGVYF